MDFELRKLFDTMREIDETFDREEREPVEEYGTHNDVRQWTNAIDQLMDEGAMDPRAVADAALSYMSEAQVHDMARANDWSSWISDYMGWNEDEDEDDEDDDEDDWQDNPGGTWGLK